MKRTLKRTTALFLSLIMAMSVVGSSFTVMADTDEEQTDTDIAVIDADETDNTGITDTEEPSEDGETYENIIVPLTADDYDCDYDDDVQTVDCCDDNIQTLADGDVTAFAVYSEDDNSLSFYTDTSVPNEGATYNGKVVTETYTGVDSITYSSYSSVPWFSHRTNITSVVIDESFNKCHPIAMAFWFHGFTNATFSGLENIDTSSVTALTDTFNGCSSLTNVDGLTKWNTSSVTNMQGTFSGCSSLTNVDGLAKWNTSAVTALTDTFASCSSLTNVNALADWDTSSVTTLFGTFWNCPKLENIDGLTDWNTSAVTTMERTFSGCSSLTNVNGLADWNTSAVTTLQYTFDNCSSLTNVDGLTEWDTSAVTTLYSTFYNCPKLENIDGLADWDTSKVTTLFYTFYCCSNLEDVDGLANWDTSNVTTLYETFYRCSSLTNVDKLANWNTSNVTTLYSTFYRCSSLTNVDGLAGWNISKVTTLKNTFGSCSSLTVIDLSGWDTSNVVEYSSFATDCSKLEKIIIGDKFDLFAKSKDNLVSQQYWYDIDGNPVSDNYMIGVSGAGTYFTYMPTIESDDEAFAVYSEDDNSLSFYYDNVPSVGDTYNGKTVTEIYTGFDSTRYIDYTRVPWYNNRTNITSVVIDESFNKCQPTAMACWFYEFTNATFSGLENIDASSMTTLYCTFCDCSSLTNVDGLSGWDISKVTNLVGTFERCSSLTNIDALAKWTTSSVTDLNCTFYRCSSLTNVDALANWNTSAVRTLQSTFYNCSSLENVDGLAEWDTSSVTSLSSMFCGCSRLMNVDGLAKWDTSAVASMSSTFYGCSILTNVNGLANWDTSSVTTLYYTFYNCSSLTNVDGLAGWDASAVTDMEHTFDGCSILANVNGLANWNTSNVTTLYSMFYGCSSLENVDGLAKWDTSKVTDLVCTFDSCSSLKNVDGLAKWDTLAVTDVRSTFWRCSGLTTMDLSGWDTSNVVEYSNFAINCSKLEKIIIGDKFDLFAKSEDALVSPSVWYDNKSCFPVSDNHMIGISSAGTYTTYRQVAHTWGVNPTFDWSSDYKTCTATFTCMICGSTEEIECTVDTSSSDATCTTPGTTTYTASCTFDGQSYSDIKTTTTPALGHEFSEDVYSFAWYTDDEDEIACNIFFPCQREGCDYIAEIPCDVVITTVDPTCTEDGYTDYYAEFVYEEVDDVDNAEGIEPFAFIEEDGTYIWSDNHIVPIEALGHEFSDEDYYFTWDSAENEDGKFEPECQIHFPCQHDDCGYEAVFDCDVTVTTTDPTCTEDGETDYCAVWTYTSEENNETYTFDDTETVTIDALGHEWDEPVFNWDDFGLETGKGTVTATFICTRGCEETVECTITSEEDGDSIIYTAIAEFEGEEYTDTAVYEKEKAVIEQPDDQKPDDTEKPVEVTKTTETKVETPEETKTETIDYGGKEDVESPKTGDITLTLACSVAILAILGGTAAIMKRKEKEN